MESFPREIATLATRGSGQPDGGAAAVPTALACLAIIARQLGAEVDAAGLARASGLGTKPMTTDQLLGCARRAGLESRVLRLGFDDLVGLEPFLPAIVRLKDGSCMVLTSVHRDADVPSVLLQDPAAEAEAPLPVDRLRFEQAWTGDAVLVRRRRILGPSRPFGWPLIRRLLARERALVRDLAVSTLALSFVALTPILFVQLLAQRVFANGATSTMVILTLCFAVALFAETALGALRRAVLSRLSARLQAKLAVDLFDRFLALPPTTLHGLPRGTMLHRAEGLARLGQPATAELLGAGLDLGLLVFFLPVMAFISPTLTAAFLAGALLVLWLTLRALPRFRRAAAALADAGEARTAFATAAAAGMATVKGAGLQVAMRQHWRRLAAEAAVRRTDLGRLSALLQGLATPAERLLVAGTLAAGVYLTAVVGHVAAISALIAFYLLAQRLAAPLLSLARLLRQAGDLGAALDGLQALVGRPADEAAVEAGTPPALTGALRFEGVGFRYPGTIRAALRGVSFHCPAGMLLGITGRSGAGKSTIGRLLLRSHGEHRGTITLDETDIRDVDPVQLRRAVVVLGADPRPLSGTIREAITGARVSATFEEMAAAAALAGADEFIDTLPRGYETTIAEGAPALSRGQRQRLALAGALLAEPRILVLDEALSGLDGEVEARVLANLRALAGQRTILLVTHRPAALMATDAVLVLDEGEVRGFGPHREMLETSDLYSDQWHRERVPADPDPQTDRLLALS